MSPEESPPSRVFRAIHLPHRRRDVVSEEDPTPINVQPGEMLYDVEENKLYAGLDNETAIQVSAPAPVQSVAGKTGAISIDHRDVSNLPTTLSQFTSDQNDLSLGTGGIIRISAAAARNITGFAGGSSGDARLLVNVGSFTITLKHQSTSSAAANRIIGGNAADVEIPTQGSMVVYYDGTDSRWRAG
jgi:hypothetical protein